MINSDALLTMRDWYLLRRDLPWRRRRVDEIGGQLRVSRFGILDRLLLYRPVAPDAIGQRQQLDRGFQRQRRQQTEHGGNVFLVAHDQVAFELAIGAVSEQI